MYVINVQSTAARRYDCEYVFNVARSVYFCACAAYMLDVRLIIN